VRVDERLEVRVAGYGRELGRLDLQVDLDTRRITSSTWKRIPIDSRTIPAAPDVAQEVAEWEAKVAKVVDIPIGESKRLLAQPEVKALMERAIMEELGVDLAFVNRGGVRDVIPQGPLLARHIWNVMPFDNRMLTGRFLGSQLPAALREGRVIDPAREYTFAVPDFVALNQSSNLGASGLEFRQSGPLLRDLLIDWVKKKKVLE
jgi:2',3'-cyclic-nucleotide 2'-phosphodiesterase (5'-nucleotidase family)